MRDKIEEIIAKTAPKPKFQLIRLEKVEDWIAYTSNIIQTLGFKVSATWRLSWGDRLYYIIEGALGPLHTPETKIRIVTRVEDKDEKRLVEYYIQNVVKYWIRDITLDRFLNEVINDALMRW
jgi:hypothetical protein